MKRDVYAGDLDLGTASTEPATRVRVVVHADADPDVLLRVAVQLNLANRAPTTFHLCSQEDEVIIETELVGVADTLIDMICRKLAQLTCVREVKSKAAIVVAPEIELDGPTGTGENTCTDI